MTDKTGGPAFPLSTSSGSNESVNGMTLRDYFAGQLLCSVMSATHRANPDVQSIAKACYAFADAMLAEREKGGV